MRVTFLMPADNLTGGARVVAIYARQLQDLGHEVLVVSCAPDRLTPREQWRTLKRRDWQGLKHHFAPPQGHVAASGVPHKVLQRLGPITAADVPDADVVIATWWETAVWMDGFGPSKGRKVHLIQGFEVWLNPGAADAVRAALQLPNRKIAISSDLVRTLEQEVPALKGTIAVVPNAVDTAQFDAPPRARQHRPTVGYVYAHAHIKGADLCAQACALARERLPALQVLAFGADRPTAQLPLPAGSRFEYRPAQARLREIYASCDVWLFASRMDSFGLPILEAMACRTPVVAVPVGAAQDLLRDGAGVLVPPEQPQALADALVALLSEPEVFWRQRAQAAHARAHGYSWTDAARRLLELM